MGSHQKKIPTDRTNAGKGGKAAQQKGLGREIDREAEAETGEEAVKAVGGRTPGGSHRRGGGRVVSGASAEARGGSLDADIATLPGARARADERTIRDDGDAEASHQDPAQAGAQEAVEDTEGRAPRRKRARPEAAPPVPPPGSDHDEIEHQLAHRRRTARRADADTSSADAGQRGPRADDKKSPMRQSPVAPKAEPSTRGANQWVSGRRNKRKVH